MTVVVVVVVTIFSPFPSSLASITVSEMVFDPLLFAFADPGVSPTLASVQIRLRWKWLVFSLRHS